VEGINYTGICRGTASGAGEVHTETVQRRPRGEGMLKRHGGEGMLDDLGVRGMLDILGVKECLTSSG
jgi:hypothetical protein